MSGAWTTGTCAAAAAKAAALHAAGRLDLGVVDVPLPGGRRAEVEVRSWGGPRCRPWASVRKPVSDDPDATRGALVSVALSRSVSLRFRAGSGVGTVTRPGLQLAVGEPAINGGPRAQIAQALLETGGGGWCVTVSVSGGERIAQRTFNPRLGIEGGISILGSSGEVRPWSLEAMRASIDAHMGVVRARGQETLVLVPGHMGERAAASLFPGAECVEVGNAWGEAIDLGARHGFSRLVVVGHPGKLVKLAQGQWDTHSSSGSSAATWARRYLVRVLGTAGSAELPRAVTLEGLLDPLEPAARGRAASLLACRVARALRSRAGVPARVVFVALRGQATGEGES